MTFLELCQELHRECGVAGSTVAAVTGQTGESLRLVNWVKQAWHELQLHREDWWWMRKEFSVSTVAGDNTYTAADCSVTDLGEWKTDSFRIYKQSSGLGDQGLLPFKQYNEFRDLFLIGAQSQQRPTFATVKPDMSLCLGPIPDDVYVFSGEYYKAPTTMAADADEPTGLPGQFQMIIVYGAGMKYAAYEEAAPVYAYMRDKYEFFLARLELNQRDAIVAGAPLA